MVANLENVQVAYNSGKFEVKGQTGDFDNAYVKNCYDDWYRPYWTYWYSQPQTVYLPSKLDQAFKIASKLMEKKYLPETMTIKEFLDIVNEIEKII